MKHYDKVLDILDGIQNQTIGNLDATSYKLTFRNFEILVVTVVTQFILGYLRPLSIKLQSENCDLVETHVQARTLATSFLEIRENSEEAFDEPFNIACTIANKNEITNNKPRTYATQIGDCIIKENRTFHNRETKISGMYTCILWCVGYSYQHRQQVNRMLENFQIKQ